MSRALVFSDSHGEAFLMRRMAETVRERFGPIDFYLHCGDGAADFRSLEKFFLAQDPGAALLGVRGNCDFFSPDLPYERELVLGGARVMMCHGHLLGVKSSLWRLSEAATKAGCAIALFGHTHEPCMETTGALLVNPGAACDSRCALLEVTDGRPRLQLLRL